MTRIYQRRKLCQWFRGYEGRGGTKERLVVDLIKPEFGMGLGQGRRQVNGMLSSMFPCTTFEERE